MIFTLSILPFSCIGAAIGVWPAVSVVSRMKPWPLGLLAGGGVLVGTAAAFGLLGLGLMLLFIPFFTGELIEIPRAMMGAGVIFVAWLLFDAIFSEFGQWMGTGVMCVASLLWAVIWVYILRSFSKWANRR